MENDKLLQLIDELKDIDRITALILEKVHNSSVFGNFQMNLLEICENRLRNLFRKNIDYVSRDRLDSVNERIGDGEAILANKGWLLAHNSNGYYAIKESNFTNQEDPEFATHDTYIISRDENGFYVNSGGASFNQYYAMIYKESCNFLEENEDLFLNLHTDLCELERIMNGDYQVADTCEKPEILPLISNYLNFSTEEKEKNVSVGR